MTSMSGMSIILTINRETTIIQSRSRKKNNRREK